MNYIDKKHIVHGPRLLESIPSGSYGQTVYRCLQDNYNLPIAIVDAVTRKPLSYKTVIEKSLRLAHSLRNCGVTQNDVIGISTDNNPYSILPVIAGLWLGATVTLFNPQYTSRELLHVATISKPNVIFCTKIALQSILEIQTDLKYLKRIIVVDGYSTVRNAQTMEDFVSENSRDYRGFEPVDVDAQQVAFILYSSGTTGLPKGVMITHYNLNAAYTIFRDPRYFVNPTPGTFTVLGLLPLFHIFGVLMFLTTILHGGSVLCMSKFEKHSFLKAIQDFKLKSVSTVPSIVSFLANSELVDKYDLSSLVQIRSGAAPLNMHTQEVLLNRFKNIDNILEGYGLTELTGAAVLTPPDFHRTGSVGKILPATSAKVLDIETGNALGPGKRGELYFRGPQVMKGYVGDTNNSDIDQQGWFRTGDIGYYDEDGYFYVVDRLKELIKYKGFQVPPAELEAVLVQHPKIADAAVIGVADEIAGEVPLAFIVTNVGQTLNEDEVKIFVKGQVVDYKQLRGGVRFVEEIPRNATGKILRRELRQLVMPKSKL